MNYLIFCGPGIGDFIITLPMAKIIKENDPDGNIIFFTCSDKDRIKNLKEMIELQEYINNIVYYSGRELINNIHFLFKLGYHKFDFGFRSSYFDTPYISDWPDRIIKYASKKSVGVSLLNKQDRKYDIAIPFLSDQSVYQTPIDLIEAIGFHEKKGDTNSLLSHNKIFELTIKNKSLQLNKKSISLVIGTANTPVTADGKNGFKPAKNWSYDNWNKLSNMFSSAGYDIILLGGNKEKEELEKRNQLFINGNIVNLCGKCTITESIGILCHSQLVIGCDTGLMHCAGAVGVPSLTLFGCTDYKKYLFPSKSAFYISSNLECSPCFGTERLLTCDNFRCMRNIKPEMVFEKAINIIEEYNFES